MPELPEVEILRRHLQRVLPGRFITDVLVRIPRLIRPEKPCVFRGGLKDRTFGNITRRGKFLVFEIADPPPSTNPRLIGHLGMTGRVRVLSAKEPPSRHEAIRILMDSRAMIITDVRQFGHWTLDTDRLSLLGPEPDSPSFNEAYLSPILAKSPRAIKVVLMDQNTVAGLGNIYANEILFSSNIHPNHPAKGLSDQQIRTLIIQTKETILKAIKFGGQLDLNWNDPAGGNGIFYFGVKESNTEERVERFHVYDRESQPCRVCRHPIQRGVTQGRSSFYCPSCQPIS